MNRFWVGGTGTWDSSTTTHWSASTGGAGGASAPTTNDSVTFDGSSGGGTVTADTTINGLTLNTIVMGAFTGTLDFSVNNPSLTLGANGTTGFSCNGTATRTLKLGSGTFTTKSSSNNGFDFGTVTGLTFVGGTATFNLPTSGTANVQAFIGNASISFSGNTFTIPSRTDGSGVTLQNVGTVANLNITGPVQVSLPTMTVTNAISWAGTSSGLIILSDNTKFGGSVPTVTLTAGGTIQWAGINLITFAGTAPTITNSYNLGGNSGVTITGPSAGAGGHIIGG